jgi:hypothetical protein
MPNKQIGEMAGRGLEEEIYTKPISCWRLIVSRPSVVFGGWVDMLNRAVELFGHGYDHVIRLIIPVFKALFRHFVHA